VVGDPSPRVTICLLTYNHAHVVGDVLDAVLQLVSEGVELIVSDDCSTDGTWDVVVDRLEGLRRARAIRTTTNVGMAGNANRAFREAKGEFVALLHHDDLVAPDLVRKWLSVADRDSKIAFVFNDYLIDGKAGHASEGRAFETIMNGREFLRKHLLSGWGCPVRGTALIRRSCLEAVGGIDGRYGLVADIDLWMRLSARWSVGYVAEPLIVVRHEWPAGYPEDYTRFSWRRLGLVYRIHADNEAAVAPPTGLGRKMAWWKFRARVSLESAKWLAYGLVRGKRDMLARAGEGANSYEWPPVRWGRTICTRAFGRAPGDVNGVNPTA